MKYYKVTVKASVEKEITVPADNLEQVIERTDYILRNSNLIAAPENVTEVVLETEEVKDVLDTVLALELGIQLGYEEAEDDAEDCCCECRYRACALGECARESDEEASTEQGEC